MFKLNVAGTSIQTTMSYYVDPDTDDMADELWANHKPSLPTTPAGNTLAASNTSGNNGQESAKNEESPATVNDYEA